VWHTYSAIHLSVSRPGPLGVAHVAIHLSGPGLFVRLFVSRKRLVWPEPSGINECSCPVRLDRGALLVGTGHHPKVMFPSVRSGLHTLVRHLSLPRAALGLHDRHPCWILVWSRKCLRCRATPSVSRLHSWSLWSRYTAVVPYWSSCESSVHG
jgi:hypothetical protein